MSCAARLLQSVAAAYLRVLADTTRWTADTSASTPVAASSEVGGTFLEVTLLHDDSDLPLPANLCYMPGTKRLEMLYIGIRVCGRGCVYTCTSMILKPPPPAAEELSTSR